MPSGPRDFFERHVLPTFREWEGSPADERHAKHLVGDLNILAERAFHYWVENGPADRIYGATSVRDYRTKLAENECEDVAIIRDVAEAYKHLYLSRADRRLTHTNQTTVEPVVYGGAAYYGADAYYGGCHLVTRLDDGSEIPLAPTILEVMSMWVRLLDGWGI